jgi:hypothetical protein
MECSYCRAQVNRYLDGEIGYVEVEELQAHLDLCAECATKFAEVGALRSALAQWGTVEVSPAPGFVARVVAAVEAETAGHGSNAYERPPGGILATVDRLLGRVMLPGGREVPVRKIIGWGIAAAAVVIGIERRHGRRGRELKTS